MARENWRCWTLLVPPPPHRTPDQKITNFGAGADEAVIKLPPEERAVIANYGSGSLLFEQKLKKKSRFHRPRKKLLR